MPPVSINYVSLASNPNCRVDYYPLNGFVSFQSPTVAELNAGLNISPAVSWNNYSFKRSPSTTTSDPSLADIAEVKDRGVIQYGGQMMFYYPGPQSTSTDIYTQAYAVFRQPRVTGYIVTRIDGAKPTSQAYAAGDIVSVYQVLTDAQANSITGEAALMYGITFLSQGAAAMETVAKAATNTVAVAPTSTTISSGTPRIRLAATVNTRGYTNGVYWTSSDNTKATVSDAGLVTRVAAGTATITATFPYDATATSTCTVTIT